MSNEYINPPIGITPKKIHDLMRMHEILDAMERYSEANVVVPIEWITELKELLS